MFNFKKIILTGFGFGIVLFISGCMNQGPVENLEAHINSLPTAVKWPEAITGNPNANISNMTELGRLLFWDPILSGPRSVSCATCHHPDLGYSDGRGISLGVGATGLGPARKNGVAVTRNSQTVINSAYNGIDINKNYHATNSPMFWDNRAESLEEQALIPIASDKEMRGSVISEADILTEVVTRLAGITEYQQRFSQAFGSAGINKERIGQAIAAFERGITAPNSRFDKYMRGDLNALSRTEVIGMHTFVRVGCAVCHSGPMFSDFKLHVLVGSTADGGVNGTGGFRTASLRNLKHTAPYMHNGRFKTLNEVLNFYENDGGEDAPDHTAQEFRNLDLDDGDISSILAFLNALNDDNFDRTIPNSVPSRLRVGGDI